MNRRIKCLIMDVDGTLTDGKIYMGVKGELLKTFNIKDGYGIHDILIPRGIVPVIITGRCSEILQNRCKELGISQLYQGVNDKVKVLMQFCEQFGFMFEECSYIGDDLNDISCMKLIKDAGGIVGCPADAVEAIYSISDFKSQFVGGNGAVREFIEWIINNL